jgi:GNAT superfamily N-acetyltransferase
MNAHAFEIRRADREDAPLIADVLYDSFGEFKDLYMEEGFAATALNAEEVLKRMNKGPVWVAMRRGVVLGTVAAVAKDGSAYIRGMAVLPAARGSGAGTFLLNRAERWAASQGFNRVFLSTTPFLDPAIRLYEKSGFRRKDDRLHDLFGTPLFFMEKIISE